MHGYTHYVVILGRKHLMMVIEEVCKACGHMGLGFKDNASGEASFFCRFCGTQFSRKKSVIDGHDVFINNHIKGGGVICIVQFGNFTITRSIPAETDLKHAEMMWLEMLNTPLADKENSYMTFVDNGKVKIIHGSIK